MKAGIMQPYFMPYIGYWQLMNAVDRYVIYDDVNFIKGGWINRNRILINGEPKYFNIQMKGASPHKRINEIEVSTEQPVIQKNLRILEAAYKKAPCFGDSFPILEDILCSGKKDLASLIRYSFEKIADYLDIRTEFIVSSELDKRNELKGQDKVLEICRILGASEYYNAIGGRELYSFEAFREKGIKLCFLKTDKIVYTQFGQDFLENLSMIDVMMFNTREQIKEMLGAYTLITEGEV